MVTLQKASDLRASGCGQEEEEAAEAVVSQQGRGPSVGHGSMVSITAVTPREDKYLKSRRDCGLNLSWTIMDSEGAALHPSSWCPCETAPFCVAFVTHGCSSCRAPVPPTPTG